MKKTSSYSSQSCDHVKLHSTISSQRHHRNTANAPTTTLQTHTGEDAYSHHLEGVVLI